MSTLGLATVFAVLVDAALRGSVILLAALAATRLMKRGSAAARHLVWVVALASMLALPLVSRALPEWRVVPVPAPLRPMAGFVAAPIVPATPVVMQSREIASSAEPGATTLLSSPPTSTVAPAQAAPIAPATAFDWKTALMALWAAGGVLLVARLAYGMLRVWWMERRAVEITDDGWVRIADGLARRLHVGRVVTLLRESHAVVPMTWGVMRPVVLLPADAEAWDTERRTVVLAHELAHVRRWDTLTQWTAHLALALFWFNPLVWVAARQLREEREHACDDAVLSIGTRPVEYADHLLSIVRSLGAAEGPAAALAMARRSQFEGRLLAILDGATARGGVSRGLGLAALVVAAAAVLPLGALRAARPADPLQASGIAASSSTTKDEAAKKPDKKDLLASFAAHVEGLLNRAEGGVPGRDTVSIPAPAAPEAAASAASAMGAASSAFGGTPSAPPAAPVAPRPSPDASSLAAVAGALGTSTDRAAAMLQDSGGYGDVIRAAAGIASASDRAAVLIAVLRRADVSPRDLVELLRVTSGIGSDPSRRDVLTEVAQRCSLAPAAVRAAFFFATSGLANVPERRDVLMAVLARSTAPEVVAAVVESTRGMTSDPERRDVLLRVVDRATSPELLIQVLGASRGLVTSSVRRDVLMKVLARPGLSTSVLREVFAAAAGIPTSAEKRDVLMYAATHQRLDAAAREAYISTANGITTSSERSDAVSALVSGGGRAAAPPASRASTTTASIHNHEDDGSWSSDIHLTSDDGSRTVRIRARQVVRGPEADDIRSIRPGGSVMVEEVRRGETRRVDMAPERGGGITRAYRVNGQSRPYEGEGARWVSAILRELTSTK